MERTELGKLGEFGLIERLKAGITTQNKETIFGIGDDAAVLQFPLNEQVLVSTDTMVEGIHFDLSYTPLKHLGYKAVVTNISDIAAMNGTPTQITVSIAISNRFSVEAIEELYEGMKIACKEYKVDLVGGDTTSSLKGLIITITVLGHAPKEQIVYRHTAQDKDIICVTGDLGAAYVGLQALRQEKEVFLANPDMQPELTEKNYVVERQLKPEARMDIVLDLKELGVLPTSMIDISDGLASELLHISTKSGLGATIFEDKLPMSSETLATVSALNLSSTACMMNGGEDYELLFTIKQSDFDKIKNHQDISTIGYMNEREKGVNLISTGGQTVPIEAQGWVHF
ncbi:MAG: thiamine-phosphate kinase [Cytophagales bacterium]